MEFIKENLLLIATLVAFIVFAIIGFVVDNTKNKDSKEKDLLKEQNDSEVKPNVEKTTTKEVKNSNKEEKNMNLENLTK